jgi:phage terminase large subunit-like protein
MKKQTIKAVTEHLSNGAGTMLVLCASIQHLRNAHRELEEMKVFNIRSYPMNPHAFTVKVDKSEAVVMFRYITQVVDEARKQMAGLRPSTAIIDEIGAWDPEQFKKAQDSMPGVLIHK